MQNTVLVNVLIIYFLATAMSIAIYFIIIVIILETDWLVVPESP